jgi:hypothetical protein
MARETVELRAEMPRFIIDVLDGQCAATGECRTELVRFILSEWANQRHHEATLILRVAGSNPTKSDK